MALFVFHVILMSHSVKYIPKPCGFTIHTLPRAKVRIAHMPIYCIALLLIEFCRIGHGDFRVKVVLCYSANLCAELPPLSSSQH
jgi:hypothetical protein